MDPVEVNTHDLRQEAEWIAAPYGIYDVGRNLSRIGLGPASQDRVKTSQ